jgi:16S rRNA (guanine966-N2)-methyltransferase
VIGGNLKKKKLYALQGRKVRPTADYLRESIFNILGGSLEGAVVLDLYAGTGSLGIEALSRGAEWAAFVEKDPQAIRGLFRNISLCKLEEKSKVFKRDILRGLGFLRRLGRTFDLVFMDPPYDKGWVEPTVKLLNRCRCTAEDANVVIEHSTAEKLPREIACFRRWDARERGKSVVSFYECML